MTVVCEERRRRRRRRRRRKRRARLKRGNGEKKEAKHLKLAGPTLPICDDGGFLAARVPVGGGLDLE